MGMSFFTNIFFNDIRESFEEPYFHVQFVHKHLAYFDRCCTWIKFAPLDYRVVTMKPIAGQFFAIKLP